MLLTHYYAVVTIAVLASAAWLFKPEDRTAITTLGAFLAWSLAALLGGSTETYRRSGESIEQAPNDAYLAVEQPAELVAAPVPDEIRLLFTLFGVLSILALILYTAGVYPPDSEQPAGDRIQT